MLKAFPLYKKINESSGILFRQERKLDKDSWITVLVQSLMRPEWELLKNDMGNTFQYDQPKEISNLQFCNGQQLRFRLCANPIKTIRDENGRKNKKGEIKRCRVPLLKENQQIAWLKKKGIGPAKSFGCGLLSLAKA